jgi:GH18 family chitinase
MKRKPSSRKTLKSLSQATGLATLISIASFCAAEFKVIGYFPTWSGNVDTIAYDKMTHVNYSFILPTATGGLQALQDTARLQQFVKNAHAQGVKALIAVGGWNDGNDSGFVSLSANANYRQTFVTNLVNFVEQYDLDGVDMDWEYPNAGVEAENFKLLMSALSQALHARGKLLSAAVTGNDWPGSIDSDVINSVDYLNLMVYDNPVPHSTYSAAESAISHWKNIEGLPKDKTVLGVPFYARTNGYVKYKDIIAQYGTEAAYIDDAGGNDYNGIPTIQAKTQLGLEEAGGIMYWEVTQDTLDDTSLMSAIWDVVKSQETGDGSGTVTPWMEGQDYIAGDIVKFENKFYIAVHDNPGYNPVISTWFWDETTVDVSDPQDPNPENPNPTDYPTWISGQSYVVGDIVKYEGALYITVNDNPGYNPTISTWFWDEYDGQTEEPPVVDPEPPTNTQTPYLGTPFSIPGIIEAEYYDINAFADTDTPNNGGALRSDAVDIEISTRNGYNLGWLSNGEWTEYSMYAEAAGEYIVQALIASPSDGGRLALSVNGQTLGSISAPVTGDWQTWQWSETAINVPAGPSVLRVTIEQQGFNLNALNVTKSNGGDNDNDTLSCENPSSWKQANLTNYESYPDPNSEECLYYNGCEWAGQFAGLEGIQPESWVAANNIAAVHEKNFSQYNGKTLQLRQGDKAINTVVYDMCADADCDGCCTRNLGSEGFLIDIEKYTMQRFGTGSGTVDWRVCN